LAKEVTNFDKKSRRLRERLRIALPARVHGRESGNRDWTEMTRLIDVTPFGARFRLMRPVDIGRLVQLTLKMPLPLRVFDHVEDQYRVWSIVRNARLLEQKAPKDSLLEVGVAFIGKRPPRSFEANPALRYEIAQTSSKASFGPRRKIRLSSSPPSPLTTSEETAGNRFLSTCWSKSTTQTKSSTLSSR
jgi:hypothetical protein